MADNTLLNSGTGGDTIATDDIGGIKYQRMKLVEGADNVNDGDISATNPLPVETPNRTATGALGSLNAAVTLSMLGIAQAAWEIDTGTLSGTVSFEATLDDSNWFAVDAIHIDGTIVTSITSFADRGHLTSSGWSQARLRVSAYTSGTSNGRMEGSSGAGIVRLGDSLPVGANTIGDVTVSSLPNEGQQTMANSISVAIASDQSVISVDDNAGALSVDAANDGSLNVQIGDGTDTAVVSAAGALSVDGSAVDQPVAGDVAHDALDSGGGGPVKIGGHATAAARANVGEADRVDASFDLSGQLRVTNETADPLIVTDDGNAILVDGSAVTQPVSAASLPLPTGAATSAAQLADGHNVTVDNASGGAAVNIQDGGNTITIDGTVTAANAAGDVAHDTADSGNPVKIGAVADSTEPAAVADADRVNLLATLNGKLVTHPYAVPERYTDGVTAAITGTGNTSVIAAPGAGLRLYITHVLVTNSHASTDTVVELKDGTTVKYRGFAKSDGGGFSVTLPTPIRLTANTAFQAANITTGSNTYVSATAYIAP